MNTIVFPTDFSAYSENAMHYAASLAKRIGGTLLLLNVYQLPVTMNEPPVLTVMPEELKNSADNELGRLKEILKLNDPDLPVETESRLGDLNDELEDICRRIHPFAVIAGHYDFKGVEKLLFGDTSLSIVRHSKYPVIVVPDGCKALYLENMAVAIDAMPDPKMQLEAKRIADVLHARLHVIHVRVENENEEALRNMLLPELNAKFHSVKDEDFIEGITEYLKLHKIDMLTIFPHRHSTIERLILRTHTKSIVEKIHIPVLCMPESDIRNSS